MSEQDTLEIKGLQKQRMKAMEDGKDITPFDEKIKAIRFKISYELEHQQEKYPIQNVYMTKEGDNWCIEVEIFRHESEEPQIKYLEACASKVESQKRFREIVDDWNKGIFNMHRGLEHILPNGICFTCPQFISDLNNRRNTKIYELQQINETLINKIKELKDLLLESDKLKSTNTELKQEVDNLLAETKKFNDDMFAEYLGLKEREPIISRELHKLQQRDTNFVANEINRQNAGRARR